MEVSDLRWSHDTIYDHFSDERPLERMVLDLILGEVKLEEIPPLQVAKFGSNFYSLSNRRLWALREYKRCLVSLGKSASVRVPVCKVDIVHGTSFTTQNQGVSVELIRPVKITFARVPKGDKDFSPARRQELRSRSPSLQGRSQTKSHSPATRPALAIAA